MITNNSLLIDSNCPLCKVYAKGFVKLNLIDKGCLSPYQEISVKDSQAINMDRAKSEIALHDRHTEQTLYGLQSLLFIMTQNHKTIYKLVNHSFFFTPLNFVYKFISYNRKVIYPYKAPVEQLRTCEPDMHRGYRWGYILFVALFTALIVNAFTAHLFTSIGWTHNFYTELLVCFGQVAWQGTTATLLIKNRRLDYLGNMSTVSLMGAILLIPVLIIASLYSLSFWALLILFTLVVGTMFLEHIRRCKALGITTWMTASWVGFRVTALILILISKGIFQ